MGMGRFDRYLMVAADKNNTCRADKPLRVKDGFESSPVRIMLSRWPLASESWG
jgi:hypothetical protein